MQRHHLPAGHNHTTNKFPRTSRLDAWSANPIEAYPAPLHLRVLAFLVPCGWMALALVLAIVLLTGCHDAAGESYAAQAAREDREAKASRDWVALQVCRGQPFTWANDKTLICHKELP